MHHLRKKDGACFHFLRTQRTWCILGCVLDTPCICALCGRTRFVAAFRLSILTHSKVWKVFAWMYVLFWFLSGLGTASLCFVDSSLCLFLLSVSLHISYCYMCVCGAPWHDWSKWTVSKVDLSYWSFYQLMLIGVRILWSRLSLERLRWEGWAG